MVPTIMCVRPVVSEKLKRTYKQNSTLHIRRNVQPGARDVKLCGPQYIITLIIR